MQKILFIVITILMLPIGNISAKNTDDNVQTALTKHYSTYQNQEYFSGIALSVYKPGKPIQNYYVGKVAHDNNSQDIGSDTLFQIGSITKSFTSAILLQLEKEKRLRLTDTLQQSLSDYPKWSTITLASMLNMTSGLPNYSDSPLMNAALYKDYTRLWRDKELIDFSYPPADFSPPLRPGYHYSNTGYILSAMLIEAVTHQPFKKEIETRILVPAELHNTFYPVPEMTPDVAKRLAHGYAYNQYDNPEIVGKDMKMNNLSWAGAAGAIVSSPSDIIKWTQALFIENKILDKEQKTKLMQLVSTTTGKPIKQTSADEPRGFGLGVSQAYDKNIGRFWFYEGQTEGFRALFMYVPANGTIISVIFNSAVNGENDHAGELMKKVYELIK